MTKRNRIINIVFLLIAIIFTAIPQSWTALSNKRLCYDPDCSELISLARTKINYSPNEEGLLGFKINTEVKVYSKEAGSRTDLWGVEIDGKHGYVSQSFLKEYKIFRKNLQHEVPIKPLPSSNKPAGKLQPKKINDKSESVTEVVKISNVQSNVLNLKSAEELPYDVTPSYEIIDGTTLNVDHNESSIQPSFATKVVQTAVVPNKKDVIVNLETDSNSGKDKGTIFTEEKLSKEVLNNKVDDNEQNISQKDDINDFVASSEEVLDLPKLNGIKIPPINANINFKNDLGKVKHTIQTAENEVVAEIQDVQSSEKHNTKEKIENNILDSNGKDAAVTVLNKSNNIDLVKTASIKSSETDKQVLPLLVESDVNQTKELPSNTIKEITDEETPNVSSKSLSENVEIKITSDIKTVAVDSQSTELEENNNATSDIKDEDTNKSDLTITSDLVTDSEHSDTSNTTSTEDVTKALPENIETDVKHEMQYDTNKEVNKMTSETASIEEEMSENIPHEVQVSSPEVCAADNSECSTADDARNYFMKNDEVPENTENGLILGINIGSNYWMTLMYLIVTAAATLIFSLGYYYIENMRRDGQLIAKINKLEKDLLVSTKESSMLIENLKVTQDKLTCIEDESFGSNEMVLSLKADLVASQKAKAELEDQVAMLEKDLESATEAGLELERMLREVLSSDNEVNPIAQSVEDLQTRLNAQQTANESLTNALNLKTQENESLSAELASFRKKYEELEVELVRVSENLKLEVDSKNNIQQTLTDKVQELEIKMKEISMEKIALQKELKNKEVEVVDLIDVINQLNSNNLDLEKLYDVSRIKAEATILLEERNELKIRLTEVEGAHSLLEEHMKVIKEEVCTLSEQCKAAEKEKKDAETRLEVLSNFFKEKEAQRQKEEAIWLQQQGEVVSTVERIQTMQNEVQNYKQQIEMLKQEILDQEREYKNQISHLETKAHEQWVIARQVERRLEESKVEAGQLRNRLTLIEKNINDVDPEVKLHRLEANGETATLPPLFIGAESSSSPIMFSGSSGVPLPPPPSYLHALFPPYLPPPLPNASSVPPYEISQRPPPLGGRLSSPPPMPLHPPASSRYDNTGSPPPMSPHLHPSFNHRIPPPPFGSDHIHSPPPPPPGSVLPAHLGSTHSWGEESLPPPRSSGFHPPQRERVRNHKGLCTT
ncbi:Transport and Golgi organization protein 1 [Dufourea novaeangliae]|uniref:Transport and Golgi organization protein 1 n=1 Tax=Dufourea novaeangliae TaxID=178035 RepID=A0A154NY54_DUFNO|nr:Transport and Golgi organization protein 1 [Dufourea novaeangliae]